MQPLSRLLITISLSLLLAACVTAPQASPANAPLAPQAGQTNQFNLLIATTGAVQLTREHWKVSLPIAAGMLLQPTDLLDPQSSATVLCAGPTSKTVTALGRVPCPLNRGSFTYDGMSFSGGQRAVPKAIPYIIYPRNTLILDPHPVLRWHDTGAITYTVWIKTNAGNIVFPPTNVISTSLRYPDTAPALQPNTEYLLVVQENTITQTAISTADPTKGLGFRLVSAEDRTQLARQRDSLMALPKLDVSARNLALAVSYAIWPGENSRGLWGESWLLLEQVAQQQDTPAIHLWRGDMLRAMKLSQEATYAYQHARQQAEKLGDTASQAEAEVKLWDMTSDKTHLQQAIKLYQELGDQNQVDTLTQKLKP